MEGDDQLWLRSGLRRFQLVRCAVTGHRGRLGVEVAIVAPQTDVPAFIDFIMLTDDRDHPTPADFPPVGSILDAVTIDFRPSGELLLSARPSSLTHHRPKAD